MSDPPQTQSPEPTEPEREAVRTRSSPAPIVPVAASSGGPTISSHAESAVTRSRAATPIGLAVRHAARDFLDWLLLSPTWRTLFSLTSTVIVGVLCGAFIAEITINGKLDWHIWYQATSFWLLLLASVVLGFYQRAMYVRDTQLSRFADKEFCIAYVRAQCLPEVAQRYKELIRKGDVGEFEKAMAELRRTLR